jgi:DNA-binding NarL/FixJ family response regulator
MFSVGFLAAVADLQAEVLPQSSATGGEPIAREPKKTPLNEEREKAIELKRQGLSNEQISKMMGMSKATIKDYLEGYPHKA